MRICKNVRYIQTVTSTFSCPKYHYYVYFFVLMQLPVRKLWPSVCAKYQCRVWMLLRVRRLRRSSDWRPGASRPSWRRQTYMHYPVSRLYPSACRNGACDWHHIKTGQKERKNMTKQDQRKGEQFSCALLSRRLWTFFPFSGIHDF